MLRPLVLLFAVAIAAAPAPPAAAQQPRRTPPARRRPPPVTAARIPTPRSVLGFEPGDDRKLADWPTLVRYYQALASASDRMRYRELGHSTLGAPMIALVISSPQNLRALDRYRELNAKLADPRGFKTAKEAEDVLGGGKTIVLITSGIHSTEVGGHLSPAVLAYRLASDTSAATREILDNVVLWLVPSLNPDGVTIVTRWYTRTLGTAAEGSDPPELYHHYVGHDNNRDWYAFTQVETQLVVDRVHDELRLHLREGVPVAVVVVPHVVVIQLGRIAALGGGSECAGVPPRHDGHAVGVERRHEPENHVVEDLPRCGARVAREPVGEDGRGEVPADFVRMDAGSDEDDGLRVAQRLLSLSGRLEGAGVGEPRVELPVALQLPQVLGARDYERDERRAQGRLAELTVPHPVARLGERLIVARQRRPVGELPVIAGIEPEHRARGGDLGRRGRSDARARGGAAPRLLGRRGSRGREPRREQERDRTVSHCLLQHTGGGRGVAAAKPVREPGADTLQPIDQEPGRAGARQPVVGPRVPHELSRDPALAEHHEQLLRVGDGRAAVVLAVHDQQRRAQVPGVPQGRKRPVQRVRLPRRPGELVVGQSLRVRRPVPREPVVNGPVGLRGREAARVPEDPVGHEAAVRAARHAQAGGVHASPPPRDGDVQRLHQVLVVLAPPAAARGEGEGVPVSRRAPWIHQQHPVPLAREHLELGEEDVAVIRVRAAVDVEDQRVALARPVAVRTHQPRLDLEAAAAREPKRVRRDRHELREQGVVQGGEPAVRPGAAGTERRNVQLARVRDIARRVDQGTAVAAQAEATELPLAGGHLARRSAPGCDGEEMNAAARFGGEVERPAVRRPHRALRIEVPGGRQVACRTARDGDHAHVVFLAASLRADERDGLAVRRPGGVAVLSVLRREPAHRAVRESQHVELRANLLARFLGLGGILHEHNHAAVGRPSGVVLAQVALGDLLRLAPGHRHEVQVAGPPGLTRRDETALVLHERQRRVHAAVEPLHVGPPRDGERRDAAPPRLLFQAVRLGAAPAVEQRFPVG